LHVEEVTLVPPTVATSDLSTNSTSTSPTPVPEKHGIAHAQTAVQTAEPFQSTETQAADTSQPGQTATPPPFPEAFAATVRPADVQVTSSHEEPREAASASIEFENVERLSPEPQSPFPGRTAQRDQISERPAHNELQQTNVEPTAQAVSDFNPSDPVQREVLVRQYLREVREWVAAPPTPIPDVSESRLEQESPLTSQWQPESVMTSTFERAREPLQTATQATQLDVHETSLSIGSISVVIEDPKPNVTTIAPTPTAPKPQPQPTPPEPISLSRYYLQRW
jgi:hypothetical protein